MSASPSVPDDRERRLRAAAEFNGRPLLTILAMGVMVLFGLVPILLAVHTAWSARRWTEVPIEVIGVDLRHSESGDRSTPVDEVRAAYRYRVGANVYVGHRIGVHLPVADNLGGWQRGWQETLARPRVPGEPPLTAWIDPAHPEEAVLDRSLRWGVLLLYAVFVVAPLWPLSLAARALVARWRLRYIK
jgi:Protein of unknown function (DUF3592)